MAERRLTPHRNAKERRRSGVHVLPLMWAAVVGFAVLVAMLGSTIATAAPGYSDVPAGALFHDQIMALTGLQIAAGFPDNTFKPENAVTRQQFAKMIVLATDKHTDAVDNQTDPTFSDVTTSSTARRPPPSAPSPTPRGVK